MDAATEDLSLCRSFCCRIVVSFFLFVSLLGLAQSDNLSAAESLRVAAIFATSGIAAQHNEPLLKMTQFAVETINRNGGVLGKKIELVVLDNESTPIGSAMAAQDAVTSGVLAVIGGHWSSHSLAMAPILQEAGIPMISPASTNPEITRGRDYIFRVCFVDSFQGQAMAHFARRDLGVVRAAVLSNIDEKYSLTLADFFKESFLMDGGEIIMDRGYRGSAADFSALIEEVIRLKPEVIYIPGYTRDSGLFIKQARKLGVKSIFLGGDAWDEIADLTDSHIDGSYQTTAWHSQVPYPKSTELKKLYMKEFGEVIENSSSPLAYDAVMVLREAITLCQCTSKEKIRDSLSSISSYQGATGEIAFDQSGDPAAKEVIIVQFRDKKPVFIKAIKP